MSDIKNSLRFKVLRGADLFDGMDTTKFSNPGHSYVFLKVQLLTEDGEVQCGYGTNIQSYAGGSIDFNEEECVFNSALPSNVLRVSVHAACSERNSNYAECGGLLLLPLSRLQDSVSVVQWYQFTPVTDEIAECCIKSAIQFEVCYHGAAEQSTGREPEQRLDSMCDLDTQSDICSLDSSEYAQSPSNFTRPIDLNSPDWGKQCGIVDEHGMQYSPTGQWRRQHRQPMTHNHTLSDIGERKDHDGRMGGAVHKVESDSGIVGSKSTVAWDQSARRPDSKLEEVDIASPGEQVGSGVVDYFLLIGPSSIPRDKTDGESLRTCGRGGTVSSAIKSPGRGGTGISEGSTRHEAGQTALPSYGVGVEGRKLFGEGEMEEVVDSASTGSDDLDKQETGLFSTICIWDKYPLCDHNGSHRMPDKMEWFVFPNGPVVVDAPCRPDPAVSSFVLHAGEDLEWYGVCLTFYLRGYRIVPEITDDNSAAEPSWVQWTRDYDVCKGGHDSQSPSGQEQWRWIGVCLCALTRPPFVDQLTQCLDVVYDQKILHVLDEFESNSRGFPVEILQLDLSKLMQALCFDCPSPLSDALGVTFNLLGPAESTITSISFERSAITEWPYCAYSLESFLALLGVRTAVDLLYHALAEHKILLYSSDTSKLPVVAEGIRTLMYPLQWCGAYIPVVPEPLLDMVGAPVPYILGICKSHLINVDPLVLKSAVIVDCDSGVLTSSIPCVRFPDDVDRWVMTAFKATWEDITLEKCREAMGYDRRASSVKVFDRCIQICFFDAMLSVFSWIPDCTYNLSSGYPIFNCEMFFDGYCHANAMAFANEVAETQAFHRLVSSIQSPRLRLFVNASKRMRYGYGYWNSGESVSNLSTEMYPFEDRRYGRDLEEVLALGEISNPRRVLIPPYYSVGNEEKAGLYNFLLPPWISPGGNSSDFKAEEALYAVLRRFRFSIPDPAMPHVEVNVNLNRTIKTAHSGLVKSKSFRDVVFPPMKFENSSEPTGLATLHRRSWTCDEILAALGVGDGGCAAGAVMTPESVGDAFNEHQTVFNAKYKRHMMLLEKNDHSYLKLAKKMHAEYMFGEDVVMRFLLRVLPAFTLDNIRDLDLSVALQEACDVFIQGAARRSVITTLREYCRQFSVAMRPVIPFGSDKNTPLKDPILLEPKFTQDKCPVQLQIVSFGYLTVLCKQLLTACEKCKDFITAYELLKISGYYYHIVFPEDGEGDVQSRKSYYIQTLRSRIIQHAVFENMVLWRIVINNALSSHVIPDTHLARRKHTSLVSCLRPAIVHMCSANMTPDRIESLIDTVVTDYEIDKAQWTSVVEYTRDVSDVLRRLTVVNGEVVGQCCEKQKRARLVIHGGTPAAKHPVSPWIDVLRIESPRRAATNAKELFPDSLISEQQGDGEAEKYESRPVPGDPIQAILSACEGYSDSCEDGADSDSEVSRKVNRRKNSKSDRIVRVANTTSPIADILSRNIEFTPAHHVDSRCHHDTYVSAMDICGKSLASADSAGRVRIVSIDSGEKIAEYKHNSAVTVLKYNPCGVIASGCASGVFKITRVLSGQERRNTFGQSTLAKLGINKPAITSHKAFSTTITCLCFAVPHDRSGGNESFDVKRAGYHEGYVRARQPTTDATPPADCESWLVAVGGINGGVKIYQGGATNSYGSGGYEVMSMSAPDKGGISSMFLTSSELHISAQGTPSRYISTRDEGSDRKISESIFVSPPRMSMLWSPMQSTSTSISGSLLLGTTRGGIVAYDLHSKESIFEPAVDDRHKSLVSCIIPVRRHELLTGGYDRVVKLWDIRSKYSTLEMIGSLGSITDAAIDAYNDFKVIAACGDNCIRFWDTRNAGQCLPYLTLEGHTDRIASIIQKNGILISGSYDGTVKSWNLSSGKCIQTLRSDLSSPVSCMALSAIANALDSRNMVAVNIDGDDEEATAPPLLQSIDLACGGWEGSIKAWKGKEL